MFGIDVETLSKLIGGIIGAILLAIVGKAGVGNRKASSDSPTPAANGIMLDGDTAIAIRDELRALRANQERFHADDERRREAEEKRGLEDDIAMLRKQNEELKRGQGVTHGNQNELLEMIRGLMSGPGVTEERLRLRQALAIEHGTDSPPPT